jgi:7-carboxy-7-deazaguanine synthase
MMEPQYQIAETFYSIQGEGEWTGAPMFFIRLANCNLRCAFCDTDYTQKTAMSIHELVTKAAEVPARKVVITGGEPLLQDTQPLVVALRKAGFKVHLETNGTLPSHYDWDWIAVSPKSPVYKLNHQIMAMASEIKFLVGIPNWEEYIHAVVDGLNLHGRILWVMPLGKAHPYGTQLLQHNIDLAVDFVLHNPQFKLCAQVHKFIGVR